MTIVDPADAVAAAREAAGQPDAPAHVAENREGYLVSFDDDRPPTARVWYWVDKVSGEVSPVGSGEVGRLSDSLRRLDL